MQLKHVLHALVVCPLEAVTLGGSSIDWQKLLKLIAQFLGT